MNVNYYRKDFRGTIPENKIADRHFLRLTARRFSERLFLSLHILHMLIAACLANCLPCTVLLLHRLEAVKSHRFSYT